MTRKEAIEIWAKKNGRDAHWESHKGGEFIDTLVALGVLKLDEEQPKEGSPKR